MDPKFKAMLIEEPVVIVTNDDFLIEGTMNTNDSVWLSNTLNFRPYASMSSNVCPSTRPGTPPLTSPSTWDHLYFSLSHATVTNLATGQQVVHSRSLLVAHSQVTALMPKSEVITLGDQATNAEHDTATAATQHNSHGHAAGESTATPESYMSPLSA